VGEVDLISSPLLDIGVWFERFQARCLFPHSPNLEMSDIGRLIPAWFRRATLLVIAALLVALFPSLSSPTIFVGYLITIFCIGCWRAQDAIERGEELETAEWDGLFIQVDTRTAEVIRFVIASNAAARGAQAYVDDVGGVGGDAHDWFISVPASLLGHQQVLQEEPLPPPTFGQRKQTMYRCPKIYEETLEKMLAEMVEMGVIGEYNGLTDYLSPLHVVKNVLPSGEVKIRLVIDLRGMNSITKAQNYPLVQILFIVHYHRYK